MSASRRRLAALADSWLYHSEHRNVPRPATRDIRPTCSRPESKRAGGGALRRGSEANHRGDTQRPFDMRARHDDEHQLHPCHRRRPHLDARPGWDGGDRVRGPCKDRARCPRLAGRNRGRRLRLDRPRSEDIRVLQALRQVEPLRHVEHTVELAGDACIEPRIRAFIADNRHGRRRGAKARMGRSSCQIFNAAPQPPYVRSRCAGASCGRCSCHGS